MWITIYVASMAMLLLAIAVWAARNKETLVEGAAAVASALLMFLTLACLGGFNNAEGLSLYIVNYLSFVDIFLISHALIRVLNDND